jgi:hypothetical protein
MNTLTITHNGTPLKVSGTYRRGYDATLEEPGEEECFEISAITDGDVDVMHLHDDEALEEIAGLALEAYRDLQAYEECEAADRQREERRFTYGVAA